MCRLTQPRCQITPTDLLPHVESLSSWYLQAFQMLHHYCNKNPIKRMVKSKKEETKVKVRVCFFSSGARNMKGSTAKQCDSRSVPHIERTHAACVTWQRSSCAAMQHHAAIAASRRHEKQEACSQQQR